MNDSRYWTYDLETYPNFFSAGFKNAVTGERYIFEISEWLYQGAELHAFLQDCIADGSVFVGYNNMQFDYPVLHDFLMLWELRHNAPKDLMRVSHADLYAKASGIIGA